MRSSCRSLSPWYVPVGSMPCSSLITSQNCRRKPRQRRRVRPPAGRPAAPLPPRCPLPRPAARTLAPIWLPHCPACRCTISLMMASLQRLPRQCHSSPQLTASRGRQTLYSSGMRAQPLLPAQTAIRGSALGTHNEAIKIWSSDWSRHCHSNMGFCWLRLFVC